MKFYDKLMKKYPWPAYQILAFYHAQKACGHTATEAWAMVKEQMELYPSLSESYEARYGK